MKHTTRYFIILLTLFFLFIAPGLSAYWFYFHPQWLSPVTTNKGQLLNPAILVPELKSHDKKWQLVLWCPVEYEADCLQPLDQLMRIRLALGRRFYDVNLVVLMPKQAKALSASSLQLFKEQGLSERRLSINAMHDSILQKNTPQLFIANPQDYLVLAYDATSQADDVFHDMKLLLTKGTAN